MYLIKNKLILLKISSTKIYLYIFDTLRVKCRIENSFVHKYIFKQLKMQYTLKKFIRFSTEQYFTYTVKC